MAIFTLSDLVQKLISGGWLGQIENVSNGDSLDTANVLSCKHNIEQHGQLRHGDKVLVVTKDPITSVANIFACWLNGLVVVPIKDGTSEETIINIASDCQAKALIQDDDITALHGFKSAISHFEYSLDPIVTGSDLALIIYTSGSTGKPKGIMLSHNNVVTSLKSISDYLNINQQERILCLSPLSFDYGLYQILFALFNDCYLALSSEAFHPLKVVKHILNKNITLLPLVPAMATALEKVGRVMKQEFPSLQKITNTGGHLSESCIRAWKNLCSHIDIYSMYGLTECKRALYLDPQDWERKIGSVGKPIPGLEAKIFQEVTTLDRTIYREAQPNEIGELFVRGPSVMQGYFNPDAAGGAQIISGNYRDDNWLSTGDLFSKDEEGYFYFKGRAKELIKQAGFCIYPTEIEDTVEANPLVNVAAVIAGIDRNEDEIARLAIQLHDDSEDNRKSVSEWLHQNIDKDYLPREIHFFEKIQLTVNSKIDKKQLQLALGDS